MTVDLSILEPGEARDPREPTPAELFRGLCTQPRIAFLDGRAGHVDAPWSHVAWHPRHEFRMEADGTAAIDGRPARGDPLASIDDFLACESAAGRSVIGMLAYELGCWLEPSIRQRARGELPVAVLVSYDDVLSFDHRSSSWSGPTPRVAEPILEPCVVQRLRVATDEAAYAELFERARAWIGAGDIYQVNLSIDFDGEIRGHPALLYERLASRHPVPYGAYIDCGDFALLSNSPELFLRRRGRSITTRPIKGTRPRGKNPSEDARRREELQASVKERAEHVMIVDLERSDLGRVAEIGSVCVEELEAVRTYPTLHHLESKVTARLRPDARLSDVLRATFPGGSITGAPKIRAIEIISELEAQSRGAYTGAILHHRPGGDFTMSIAIRTATVVGRHVRYVAGGAVVWDSTAGEEYRECLLKARAFLDAARSA